MLPSLSEIKRNTLGSLEIALFMPEAKKRFGNTREEALRSFIIPIIAFPLTYFIACLSPESAHSTALTVASLYCFRLLISWMIFFGLVYFIAKEIKRREFFYQFVTANNWITIPTSVAIIPVIYLLITGSHTWDMVYPALLCLIAYSYACTAFIAANVLRIPWELAIFIGITAMAIKESTFDLLNWASQII